MVWVKGILKRGHNGFSLTETLVAVFIFAALAGTVAVSMLSGNTDSKNRLRQDDQCTNLANNFMSKLAEGGLPRYPLHILPAPKSEYPKQDGEQPTSPGSVNQTVSGVILGRTPSPEEALPGIDPAHQMPGSTEYQLIDTSVMSAQPTPPPIGLRNALLATGALGTLQAIYNSNAEFCTNAKGRAYAYGNDPLIPAGLTGLKWRGAAAGKEVAVELGLRIQAYNIVTGVVSCEPAPVLLQPQAASDPPAAYNGKIARRGSGVRSDLGFLVTVNLHYDDPDNPNGGRRSCSVERKFQHQRMSPTATGTPFSEIIGTPTNTAPTCAMAQTPRASFTVDLKYLSQNEARGSILLCRDRSVRLRPKTLQPDSENRLRLPLPGALDNVEDCVTTGNVRGGLRDGAVTGCFVQRRVADTPWDSVGRVNFYMPGDTDFNVSRMGPPGDLWSDASDDENFILCENLQICRINGVGSPVASAQLQHDSSGNVFYRLRFDLNQDQAGCLVYVETALVDVAGNLRQGGYRGAYMADGSPSKTEPTDAGRGYCINTNSLPNDISGAYANCYPPAAGLEADGQCPCYVDRVRVNGACTDVTSGYYSVDDLAADDVSPGVTCTNGPGSAPPAGAAALNFQYTSIGRGNNTCDWDCINGYTKVLSPPSCVPPATPPPPPVSCPMGTNPVSVAGMCEPNAVADCKNGSICGGIPGVLDDTVGPIDFSCGGGGAESRLVAPSYCCCPVGTPTPTPTPTPFPCGGEPGCFPPDYLLETPVPAPAADQLGEELSCCSGTFIIRSGSNRKVCSQCVVAPPPEPMGDPCLEAEVGVGCFVTDINSCIGQVAGTGKFAQYCCSACQPMPQGCGQPKCWYTAGQGGEVHQPTFDAPYDTLALCQAAAGPGDLCKDCWESGFTQIKYQLYDNKGVTMCSE